MQTQNIDGRMFIAGQRTWSRSGATLDAIDPASGAAFTTMALADKTDVDTAVRSAGAAFEGWAGLPPLRRVRILNRIANEVIRFLFQHGYNDTTNAFKAYRRYVIDQLQPLLSNHFNLTVELPLKATVRGFSYAVVPVSWTNRRHGVSKLNLQEMGSRYLFIVFYVLTQTG